MDTKKKLERCYARKAIAEGHYREYMELARMSLDWAKVDHAKGHRDLWLESLEGAGHYRRKALEWYARYQKKCQQIAELEDMYVISYIDPEGFILTDRVPAEQLQITLESLKLLGCTHILYGKEVA